MSDITITKDDVKALIESRLGDDHDLAMMLHQAIRGEAKAAVQAHLAGAVSKAVDDAVQAEMDKVGPGIKAAIEAEFQKHVKKVEGRITRHMIAQFGEGPGDI